MRYKKLFIVIATSTAALALGAGVAFAFWSATGTGSGAGGATTAVTLTVTPSTPSNGTLFPGGPGGPVTFTITNPNPYPVSLTGLSWGAVTSTNTSSCASSNVQLDPSAPSTMTAVVVPANTTSGIISVSPVIDLLGTAGPGCQGVAFDAVLTVTGTQQA
jgi:hypothetical protein